MAGHDANSMRRRQLVFMLPQAICSWAAGTRPAFCCTPPRSEGGPSSLDKNSLDRNASSQPTTVNHQADRHSFPIGLGLKFTSRHRAGGGSIAARVLGGRPEAIVANTAPL